MATRKFKLTRLELKRQRDDVSRFQRYLPTLKLKQQQLQVSILELNARRRAVREKLEAASRKFGAYHHLLADRAGVNVRKLAEPEETRTGKDNIAGVNVPVFREVVFPPAKYSLFATPAWVDRALLDLREVNRTRAELDVLDRQFELLHRELTKIIQRVNLFEKVKIPSARDAIRVIRIYLGDAQTAAVARAKIAKAKLDAMQHAQAEAATAET